MISQQELTQKAIDLLQLLIATPSFSSEEDATAKHIENWLTAFNIPYQREQHNIYAMNRYFDTAKPTLLLNSHHDTVKPNTGYTRDPFQPHIENGKLFGLGSNDAGGCLVSLLAVFVYFYGHKNLSHNLVIAASAEEESFGPNGVNSILPLLPHIDVAIVGEPTQMQLAIAEKGLIVFDAEVKGTPSHAAHLNTDHAIYNSISVLEWFRDFKFQKISKTLGHVKMTVTQIRAGEQHNVVPATVHLVVDVRVNDAYSNQEIADIVVREAPCTHIKPRSLRLSSSSISITHPLVKAGMAVGRSTYGSPTLSDQARLSCPSLKLGPGDSTRSHSANEFIYLSEIETGIDLYIQVLTRFLQGSI